MRDMTSHKGIDEDLLALNASYCGFYCVELTAYGHPVLIIQHHDLLVGAEAPTRREHNECHLAILNLIAWHHGQELFEALFDRFVGQYLSAI